MKVARAVVAITPRLAMALRADWRKAASFYARFGITEAQFGYGAPEVAGDVIDDPLCRFRNPGNGAEEAHLNAVATTRDGKELSWPNPEIWEP